MRNPSNKYGKALLDIATEIRIKKYRITELDAEKTAYNKEIHKAAEATGELI